MKRIPCTYELVFVLIACQSNFLYELVDIFSGVGRALGDNLDIVFSGESLTVGQLHLPFIVRIQFVSCHGNDALLRRRLFKLLDPGFRPLHTLSARRVVNDQGCIGVPQIHAVEHHVALLAGQVVDLQGDVGAERLNADGQVLRSHRHGRLLIRIDLLLEHFPDQACLAHRISADNHQLKGVAAHIFVLILFLTI